MECDERTHATCGRPAPLGDAGERFFEIAMSFTTGSSGPVDLVSAHKWFNIAATLGNEHAVRLRREIADQMSRTEITTAQRAARDWMIAH